MNKNKRVIFIGSCSYSGSTILDLILGRVENGISMGEIGRIFSPRRREHFARECGCMQESCNYWDPVLKGGPNGLHLRAFREYGVSTLVDSTKDPHWIKDRGDELRARGIEVINLLVWKTPSSIRKSFSKRGLEKRWKTSWKNYHKLYFSLINEFYPFPFKALLGGKEEFSKRMENIGIDEYNMEYWNIPGHTLFGNDSAKRHLHDKGTKAYKTLQNRRDEVIMGKDKDFSHREIEDEVEIGREEGDRVIKRIHHFLEENDVIIKPVGISSIPDRDIRFSRVSSSIRRYHQLSKSIIPYFQWKLLG